MKRIIGLFIAISIMLTSSVKADEGMWLLPLLSKLNMNQMHDMGLKLTAEDIYRINHSSLKDAIVIFGRGCTGEIISQKGLVLTNHHCGYGSIQELSSVEHNYLKDGFWAKSIDQELPVKGLTVTFLDNMKDVTSEVLKGIGKDEKGEKRNKKINENIKNLLKNNKAPEFCKAEVESFFEGNAFYLITYKVYNDIRFVGAPPSSIGKFGHDTDNWMWPRHTGDFSMFRIYGDKNGNPADYSKDNVPIVPKKSLPISMKGTPKGEFSMTIGYPGSTSRYLTSWGIKERVDVINDARIVPRGIKQDIWIKDMKNNEKINIQYATKYAHSSNYWKNSIGMNRGIKKLKVIEQKRELEKQFENWVNEKQSRKEEYGKVLSNLKKAYNNRKDLLKAMSYAMECMYSGTEIIKPALPFSQLEKILKENKDDKEKINKIAKRGSERIKDFYKDYSVTLDKKVFKTMLKLYNDKISSTYHPSFFKVINKKFKGNFDKYTNYVFKKSMFTDENKVDAFLKEPNLKVLQKDPVFIAAKSFIDLYRKLSIESEQYDIVIDDNNRLFLKGIQEMNKNKVYYPDANFTMRLSFGKVGDYSPADAVKYNYFTTLKGVMEKEKPGDYEFDVPKKLKELYETKDYGKYADKDGTLHVCFTSDNDITGGNSGSPVINGNGELFGLAFDGNWEAMSGDIAFEHKLQKCINVDIRYVLFIIDKYAGATNLINEMKLVY